jgi:threonine dehydrogenase-like Zn-dependent dehydrogenase
LRDLRFRSSSVPFIPAMLPDDIMGHEMMGEVVEVGSGVNGKLKKGDRVVLRQRWRVLDNYKTKQSLHNVL